jgi:hypothetical protein
LVICGVREKEPRSKYSSMRLRTRSTKDGVGRESFGHAIRFRSDRSGNRHRSQLGWVWISNARITSSGWTATIAIPFSTLNFKSSDDVMLGINFLRFIRRKNEEDLWTSYLRIYGLERVSQAGELKDLRNIGSGRLFHIKPYVVGGFRSIPYQGTHALHSGGFALKYGLKSNLMANLGNN